ncbi:MAG: protoporphyrinogen oxidase [Solirubrobacteraceae bacterium]
MSGPPHIAIIGGGITGLAAAHELSCRGGADGWQPRVTVLEAEDRLGGKIRSVPFADTVVDLGPEALLTAAPAALELCQELGLAGELVAPLQTRTSVWTRGRLRELPAGILGGLPEGIGPVLRSGILSPLGAARASADLLLPRSNGHHDQSVGTLVRRRLGRQALERMIDPLLGGIYGGDCDRLSVRATAPRLDALAHEHRSLIFGLLAAGRGAPPPGGPMFATLPGGLERIVARLRERLHAIDVRCNHAVRRVVALADGRYRLELATGEPLVADGVIVAVPAFEAASLLADTCPSAVQDLRAIQYASVTVVWLALPPAAIVHALPGTGFLVPRAERRTVSACTWASAKWPHLADSGKLLLRCSVGRGNPHAATLDESALVERVIGDLRGAIGLRGTALAAHVTRWDRALPQYTVGHVERVERVREAVALRPGLELAGAAYGGMGVPQCISQGRGAAARIASVLWP